MTRKRTITGVNEILASLNSSEAISDILISGLNKKFGEIAYSLDVDESPTDITDFVSTGCTILDTIISNDFPLKLGLNHGGFPLRRIVMIEGDNSAGKSLICDSILAIAQQNGSVPVLFDGEVSRSVDFMKKVGLKFGKDADASNLARPVYVTAESMEKVFEEIEYIINQLRDSGVDKQIVIVIDSLASIPTKKEIENGYDAVTYGDKAKFMSLALRKITQIIGKQKVLLVLTNQVRANIGAMFGDKTLSPGGFAIGHHVSVKVKLFKAGDIKDDNGNVIGTKIRAKVIKNRIAPFGRQCTFSFYMTKGVDDLESNFMALVEKEIIKRPTTQSYELSFNEQTYKFKTTEWRENVEKIPGLTEHLRKLVMQNFILSLDALNIELDDSGAVKIDESEIDE
jgi:recombination protein RecA